MGDGSPQDSPRSVAFVGRKPRPKGRYLRCIPGKGDETVLRGQQGPDTHQPPLERDGVDAEVPDQAQVVVHVLQAAQHLQVQEQKDGKQHGRPGPRGVLPSWGAPRPKPID